MSLIPFRAHLTNRQMHDPFHAFRGEFDKLFNELYTQLPAAKPSAGSLADIRIDVSETTAEVRVRAELAGLDEKDIDLQVVRDVLTLRGEKTLEKEDTEPNYHLIERSYGSFARSVRLPFEPRAEDVSASFKNGLLTITVKKPEVKKDVATKIAVTTA